ncbi:alanine--tRNA ligase [Candidatus Soleaferrea massiliensis]|uniref:alanine--tRNA ligase n=1 Tax=Candidatus Soleaferrea massiliensis TaxID=1470354 RepID=UPI00058C518B|nr:alanine--tRNA ligase [Candidatus Soleaferrea massiliensis]
MQWTGLNELREKFLSFFESKQHTRLPSFPLVPIDDNSLLLINSGMAPMKKWFLGQATPPNKRVTTCQKCIRTPDIERVGKTSRHGTYFEMMGNFSFGDYFKVEATKWAWEFVTEVLELPVDKLWVTIYLDDDEAFDIWTKQVGVSPDRIVRLGKEDNFWEIGTGPCGPCSEIYYDRGPENSCGKPDCAVGCDCDRYVEFWNLVFSQFDNDGNGNYTKLEHPNIDTGMGLERLACIMQGVDNLFEVDTVQNIMKHIMEIAGVKYHESEKTDVSLRVITDHIRSTTFMICDGVIPSNEGRGYVLRRLLRRAARHGRLLGIQENFLYKVVDTVIQENKTAYPELVERQDYIKKVVQVEEERFSKTIDQGMELLNHILDELSASEVENARLSGEQAFKLYDTFGFPVDLTKEIIEERGVDFEEDRFLELMNEQRERARNARADLDSVGWSDDVLAGIDEFGFDFLGYETLETPAGVQTLVKNGEIVDSIEEGDEAIILLDKTPFYAESGGQIGDAGSIESDIGVFEVFDCKKSATGHYMHIGRMKTGVVQKGDKVKAIVNMARRKAIMRNHTAVHLLQAALRRVLGDHVHQAGSLVEPDRLRFDFSHFSAVTPEELRKVEFLVNEKILEAIDVSTREMSIDEAKKSGAMALFSEKYGDVVRVVGVDDYSVELCGGTHIQNTAQIGLFKIISESSVAAGIRRIEATTGFGVLGLLDEANSTIQQAADAMKLGDPHELVHKAAALTAQLKEKDRELEQMNEKLADTKLDGLMESAMDIDGIKLAGTVFTGTKPEMLRKIGDRIKENRPDMVALLCSFYEGKPSLMMVCGKDAIKQGMHAGKLIKEVSAIAGGSGGGRPDSAMGGIPKDFPPKQLFEKLPEIIRSMKK